MANSSSDRGRALYPASPLCRNLIWLGLAKSGTCCYTSSNVQLPCCVQSLLFPSCCQLAAWLFCSFRLLFLSDPEVFGEGSLVYVFHLELNILQCLVPCTMADCGSLCYYLLQTEASLVRVERGLNLKGRSRRGARRQV